LYRDGTWQVKGKAGLAFVSIHKENGDRKENEKMGTVRKWGQNYF
jgi:hypothetical protein